MKLKGNFINETYEDFKKRYLGFGKEIYTKIKNNIHDSEFQFYQAIDFQLYAIFKNDQFSFEIQLDPLCEVIVLWNKTK